MHETEHAVRPTGPLVKPLDIPQGGPLVVYEEKRNPVAVIGQQAWLVCCFVAKNYHARATLFSLALITHTLLLFHAMFTVVWFGHAPSQQQPSGPLNNMGINVPALNYFNNAAIYSDVANQLGGNFGPWDNTSNTGAVTLDSTGAPLTTANTAIPANFSGNITWTWTGSGTLLNFANPLSCSLISSSSNSIVYNCPPVGGSGAAYWFQATPTTSGSMSNIHATLPAAQTCGMFYCQFISDMASFTTLRFMDTMNTNFDPISGGINGVINWSQRTYPVAGSRADRPQGIAYEDVITLGNQTGKSMWINVPGQATDEYVCRLARLFAFGESGTGDTGSGCNATLGPGLNGFPVDTTPLNSNVTLFVEHGNEPWNYFGFQYSNQLYCWANGVAPPSNTCPNGTTAQSIYAQGQLALPIWTGWPAGDPYGKAHALQCLLTLRNKNLFQQAFSQLGSSQVQIVFNEQSGTGGGTDPEFTFMQTNYGQVGFDVMATAPYASLNNPGSDTTLNLIFADLNSVIATIGTTVTGDATTALGVGAKYASYEGNQDMTGVGGGGGNTALMVSAMNDPRMNTAMANYFTLWRNAAPPGSVLNFYDYVQTWIGSSGAWGARQNQADPCGAGVAQVWSALLAFTGGAACAP